MLAMATNQWVLIGVLALLYVVMCVRIARRVGRTGRSAVLWFFTTFALTALPAAIVLMRHQAAQLRKTPADAPNAASEDRGARCRHCGAVLTTGPTDNTCPHCGMILNEDHLA